MSIPENQIDKRVRESFLTYHEPPPMGSWSRLEQAIAGQRHARVLLMRRRILLVAAVFIAFITGYFIAFMNYNDDGPITGQDSNHTVAKSSASRIINKLSSPISSGGEALKTSPLSGQSDKIVIKGEIIEKKRKSSLDIAPHLLITSIPIEIIYDDASVILNPIQIPNLWPSLDAIVVAQNIHTVNPQPSQETRWSIMGIAGQTYGNYYNSNAPVLTENSYTHDVLETSKSQITKPLISYGLWANYHITSRLGISSGLAMYNFSTPLNQGGQEVTALSNAKPVSSDFGLVQYTDGFAQDLAKSPLLEISSSYLEQRFTYLEVPLTGSYQIIDKRIGLALNAGVSGNFLTSNRVLLIEDRQTREMGTTEGVRDFMLNGILSMDLTFSMGRRWKASFTPVYRHAFQSANTNSSLSPHIFSMGLYSGLKYTF